MNAPTPRRRATQPPWMHRPQKAPLLPGRTLWFWLASLGVFVTLGFHLGCGGPAASVNAFLADPQEKTFLSGLVAIKARFDPASQVQRASLVLRHLEKENLSKELARIDNPPASWDYDWDTTKELDGPYEIQLQVLRTDGHVQEDKIESVWVVNRPAQLSIKECKQPPIVTRDTITLTLDWANVPVNFPPTTVELFVQGKSKTKKTSPPYTFALDFSDSKDGEEIYINAVATQGIYRGSTSVCSVRIDRQGPRVRFLFPEKDGATVPGKFAASVEVEEEYGVQEVRILADNKVVGKLDRPPYQIPVDLSSLPDRSKVTLKAIAVDRAGNETQNPPQLEVIVDRQAPEVTILTPVPDSHHLEAIDYKVTVVDASGLGVVDFYILNEKDERVDNILHRDGQGTTKPFTFAGKIFTPLSRYGAGPRKLEVVARDIHGNVTTLSRQFVIGCKTPADCPKTNDPINPYLCLGNRCIVPRGEGERCTYDFSCKPPLVCHFGGLSYCAKVKLGICRKPCKPNRGDCAGGEFCLEQSQGPSVCFPGDPCSPFTYNCSKKEQCTPWGADSFICLPAGFARVGEPCKPYACDNTLNCEKGMVCIPSQANPDKGTCKRLCDQEFPTRDCQGTQYCTAFPLRDRNVNSIGYCTSSTTSPPGP